MGHTVKRCKEPVKEEDGGFDGGDTGFNNGGATGFGETTGAGGNEWETPAAPVVSAGGW